MVAKEARQEVVLRGDLKRRGRWVWRGELENEVFVMQTDVSED